MKKIIIEPINNSYDIINIYWTDNKKIQNKSNLILISLSELEDDIKLESELCQNTNNLDSLNNLNRLYKIKDNIFINKYFIENNNDSIFSIERHIDKNIVEDLINKYMFDIHKIKYINIEWRLNKEEKR